MSPRNSHTVKLDAEQQERLVRLLENGNYEQYRVEHARIAGRRPDCTVVLYNSGKCLVQGKGAEDWVMFELEPKITGAAQRGYEAELQPEIFEPHIGVDESGKGDFFGPLVIASAYTDRALTEQLKALDVRDSKTIKSDRKILDMARKIRGVLGARAAVIRIGPAKYNQLYGDIGNVNRLLAWGHARAIENLLDVVPDCPRAVADQFGPKSRIEQALMKKGRSIQLEQRHRAESDPAVAAASILARAAFVDALARMGKELNIEIPKGASARVQDVAAELVAKHGPAVLTHMAKLHFKTTDAVLAKRGLTRNDV